MNFRTFQNRPSIVFDPAKTKVIYADDLNLISSAMSAILASFVSSATLSSKGTWNPVLPYSVGDIVDYSGLFHICVSANTGELPTDTNFWI